MTRRPIGEIKARMRAHIDPDTVDPPNSIRAILFDILDSSPPHTIRLTYPGVVPPNSMLLGEVFIEAIEFSANFSGSRFRCAVAPNGAYTLRILKNGADVGAITFAASGTTASLSTVGGAPIRFEVDDVLQIVSQSDLDVISGLFGVLTGSRV